MNKMNFMMIIWAAWLSLPGTPAWGQEPSTAVPPAAESPAKIQPAATQDATLQPAATQDATLQGSSAPTEETVITKTVDPGYLQVTLPRLAARGPNLASASLGLRAGLSDNSPGGFHFAAQYAWQVSRAFWLDSQFSASFGGRCDPPSREGEPTACGGLSGFGADILVGVMMQFLNWPHWEIPLNPYARALTGVSFIISNGPNDGAAVVVRVAGGLRYAFTDEFAAGAELGLSLGPSFRNDVGSGAFSTFDFLLSAEYSF